MITKKLFYADLQMDPAAKMRGMEMFVHQLTDDAELRLIEPSHADELYSVINRNRSRLLPRLTFVENSTSADSERAFAKRGLHQFADGQGFHEEFAESSHSSRKD